MLRYLLQYSFKKYFINIYLSVKIYLIIFLGGKFDIQIKKSNFFHISYNDDINIFT